MSSEFNGSNQTHETPAARVHANRPRTGPIVWGVLVLTFCVYIGGQMFAPGRINATAFVITALIGLGLLLLAVAAAVIVRARRYEDRENP
jgi:hypothetical protein